MDQLVEIHAEPRILIVSVGLCGEPIVYIGIYAPHSNHGTRVVMKFWDDLFQKIALFKIDLSTAVFF